MSSPRSGAVDDNRFASELSALVNPTLLVCGLMTAFARAIRVAVGRVGQLPRLLGKTAHVRPGVRGCAWRRRHVTPETVGPSVQYAHRTGR